MEEKSGSFSLGGPLQPYLSENTFFCVHSSASLLNLKF